MNSASNSKSHPFTNRSRNPLNQFLVEKFSNLKRIADSRGFKNQSFCYSKILKSLMKYPMPILSLKQMTEIEGIGEKTSYAIIKMIKKNYSDYLEDKNNSNATEEKGRAIFDNLSENDFASEDENNDHILKSTTNKKTTLLDNQANKSNLKRPDSFQKNEFDHPEKRLKIMDSDELLERSSMSKSKQSSKFKVPEAETNPWAILIGLFYFQQNQQRKYATKKEIKSEIEKISFKCEINNWTSTKTLIKNELIYNYSFDSTEKYCLSDEGEKLAQKMLFNHLSFMQQMKDNESRKENDNYVEESKAIDLISTIESSKSKSKLTPKMRKNEEMASQGINFSNFKSKLNPIQETKSEDKRTSQKKILPEYKFAFKTKSVEKMKLLLIIDNREVKTQSDRNYIYNTLVEKGLDCELGNLPIGDFLWIMQIKEFNKQEPEVFVLDYIIERKKADDLASSILDGRYKSQKIRLKKSEIPHVFYLIEGKTSQNAILPQTTINSALISIQLHYNFKVHITDNLQESLKWISHFTLKIEQNFKNKLKNEEEIGFRLTLEDFIEKNLKNKISVGEIFKNMLLSIPACGKTSINEIYKFYKTPMQLFLALENFDNFEQRVSFLNGNNKKVSIKKVGEVNEGINIARSLGQKISALFCERVYPNLEVFSNSLEDEDD